MKRHFLVQDDAQFQILVQSHEDRLLLVLRRRRANRKTQSLGVPLSPATARELARQLMALSSEKDPIGHREFAAMLSVAGGLN
jgi:hypothetical protein